MSHATICQHEFGVAILIENGGRNERLNSLITFVLTMNISHQTSNKFIYFDAKAQNTDRSLTAKNVLRLEYNVVIRFVRGK